MRGVRPYVDAVCERSFPAPAESYDMSKVQWGRFVEMAERGHYICSPISCCCSAHKPIAVCMPFRTGVISSGAKAMLCQIKLYVTLANTTQKSSIAAPRQRSHEALVATSLAARECVATPDPVVIPVCTPPPLRRLSIRKASSRRCAGRAHA